MTDEQKKARIAALLTERAGYENRAKHADDDDEKAKWTARVDAVNASLRAFGAEVKPAHKTAERRATSRRATKKSGD